MQSRIPILYALCVVVTVTVTVAACDAASTRPDLTPTTAAAPADSDAIPARGSARS